MNKTALVIEDDRAILNFISTILTSNDYQVIQAENGGEGIRLCAINQPDIVILDLGLPDMDGLSVLKNIRSYSEIPIIVVSARNREEEKVLALDEGADDYVTKPFGSSELLARMRTALRHVRKQTDAAVTQIKTGDLVIDFDKHSVLKNNESIHLTPTEYKILQILALNLGKVLTHDFIAKEVWGPYLSENQSLRVNMSNIRRKIEENPAEPKYIMTEIGVGYRFVEQ